MDSLPMSMDRDSLQQLLGELDNVLIDCEGTLWRGAQGTDLVPRASEVITRLQTMGKNVFLITNNSTKTQDEFHEKCRSLGINVSKDHIICSSAILAQYLRQINFQKKVYVVGGLGLAQEIDKVGIQCIGVGAERIEGSIYNAMAQNRLGIDPNVGAVAVGFDREFSYDKLVRATTYLSNPDCLFLATNTDEKYMITGTKHYLPAAGVLVKSLEFATNRVPRIMGKPSLNMFYMLQACFNLQPQKTMIIGDTLNTDIAFGNECGMWTILVLSGVSTLQDARDATHSQDPQVQKQVPFFYLESIGDVLTLLDSPVVNQADGQEN